MPSTDTRIVQMQFDNKDFEKNIAVSQESLEKFKDELDFDEQEDNLRSFGEATKKLSFDSMAENLQKLTDKFTGLGTVSELVLSQIRRGIESAAASVSRFIDSMTTEQIHAGEQKYEMLNKSVQTIKAATGRSEDEVYAVMKRLNEYTDQTSYNFADMAQNIGKFTSVGIGLEQAERQMEGIANWAARSGAGVNEASRAMYNLSQAMGVGSLKLMDWKSIENAGMATQEFKQQLIDAGVAAGTLVKEVDKKTGKTVYKTAKSLGKQVEVTTENMSQSLSKGWANRQVLENTLEGYYWEDLYYEGVEPILKLDEAQKEAFDKMLENDETIDAADWKGLQNMGVLSQEVKEQILDIAVSQGKLTKEVKADGKVIYKAVNKAGKNIEFTMDNMETSLGAGWFNKAIADKITGVNDLAKSSYEAAQKCLTFSDVLGAWKDMISTGWMTSFQHIFGNLSESMELFSTICNKVSDALSVLSGERNRILEIWGNNGGRNSLWGLLIGEYQDGENVMYEGAYGLLDVLTKIGEMLHDGFWNMIKMIIPTSGFEDVLNMDEFKEMFPDFEGGIDEFWELDGAKESFFAYKINSIILKIQEFVQSVKDFFDAVPEGGTKTRFQMIQDVVNAIFATALLVWTIIKKIGGFIGGLATKLQPSFDKILGLLSRLGIGISDTAKEAANGDGLTNFFNGLLDVLTPVTDAINLVIGVIADLITNLIDGGTESGTFASALQTIGDVFTKVVGFISKLIGPAVTFIADLINIISDLFNGGLTEENLKNVGAKLETAFNNLFNGIFGAFGEGIGEKIQSFFAYIFGFSEETAEDLEGESAKTIVGTIKIWLRKLFGMIGSIFDGLKGEDGEISLFTLIKENLGFGLFGKFLSEFGKMLQGMNLYHLLTLLGVLFLVFKAIQAFHQAGGMFKAVKGFFGGLGDSLKNGFKLDIGDKTESFGDKLLKIAKGIALIAASVAVLGSMKLSALGKGIGAVAAIMLMMIGFTFVMKKILGRMGPKEMITLVATIGMMGLAISAIAISMGFLVLMLKPLAKLNTEQIVNMLLGFAGIILVLGIFMKYVSSDFANTKLRDMLGVAALALGIGIMVRALLPLKKVNLDELLNMMIGLAAILGELILFAKLLGNSTFKDKGLWGLIGLAAGIGILILSLQALTKYQDPMDFVKMFGSLAVVLLMLAGFSRIFGTLKGTGMGKVIILALGIVLLMEAIKPLAAFDWEQLGKMFAGLGAVLAMLVIFSRTMGTLKGTGMMGFVGFALGMVLLMEALKPLATFEWEDLGKMGAALVAVLVSIGIFLKIAGGMGIGEGVRILLSMIGFAAVFAAFGLALSAAKGVSWDSILAMCGGMILVMLAYAVVVEIINNNENAVMKGTHALIAMLGLAAVMFIFSISLNEIKNVKTDKILAFSIGLAVLIAAVGLALKLTNGMSLGAAVKGILIIAAAVAAMMLVLSLLLPIVTGAIASSLQSMSAKLTLTADMLATFMSRMGQFTSGDIEEAKVKFEKFVELLASLRDVSGYADAVNSFALCLMDLGAGVALFQMFVENIPDPDESTAIKLVKKILEMKDDISAFTIGEFATGLTNLGSGLSQFNTLSEGITEEDPIPLKLTKNILALKDQFEAFTVGNFSDAVTRIGAGLFLFNALSSGITTDNPLALSMMTKILDFKDKIDAFKDVDVDAFSSKLSTLGGALKLYAAGASEATGLEEGEVPDVSNAVAILQAISESFTGEEGEFTIPKIEQPEEDLALFGARLAALAEALKQFAEASDGLDEGKTKLALKVLTFLKDLQTDLTADNLSRVSVFKDNSISEYTITTFSTDIVALAWALTSFAASAESFDPDKTSNALGVLAFLKDLKTDLTKDNLEAALAFKEAGVSGYTLTTFSNDIIALGGALQGFNEKTSGISDLTNAKSALGFLLWLKQNLTADAIKATLIFKGTGVSQDTLKQFALDITELGQSLASFANNVNFDEGKTKNFNAALEAFGFLVTMAGKLPVIGGLKGLIEGNIQTLGAMAGDITQLGAAMKEFSDALTGGGNADLEFNLDIVESALSALKAFGELANLMSQTDGDDIFNNYIYFGRMAEMFSAMVEGEDFWNMTAYNTSISFVDGLVQFMSTINSKIAEAGGVDAENLRGLKYTIESLRDLASIDQTVDFNPVGSQIAAGVAQGILSDESNETVCEAAREMIRRIKAAAEAEAIIQSPSRLFADGIGKYLSLGVAKGITDNTDKPEEAAENLVDGTMNGAFSAFALLSQLLTEGIDTNPTITPVLDLTNVQQGLTTMGGLFGGTYGANIDPSLAARLAGVSMPTAAETAAYQQPVDLSGIMESLSAMNTEISSLGARISAMKLYLDGKSLVGGIMGEVDQQLGRSGFYAQRRN